MSSSSSTYKVIGIFWILVVIVILLKPYGKVTYQFFQVLEGNDKDTEFRFASFFQDNMVLQAEPYHAILWGYGVLGSTVEIHVNGLTYSRKVSDVVGGKGVWILAINPQPAGTCADVTATHTTLNKVQSIVSITNIIFGDVWMCGGQSNMVFPIGHMFNYTDELDIVDNYPNIRIFTSAQVSSKTPLYDLEKITQNWAVPTKANVVAFSAVCWLFGRHLQDKLKIPVGLVQSDWGGTPVEAWSSPRALEACGLSEKNSHKFSFFSQEQEAILKSSLWNAMIHPFLNMTVKGAIWYQGEANAHQNINLYNCTFPSMITDWRKSWYEGTKGYSNPVFPFGFVQLATITSSPENDEFPLVRWHQTADYGYAPNPKMSGTFMAAALDLSDPNSPYGSVHIRDKPDVGLRLASAGLHYVYQAGPNEEGPYPIKALQIIDTVVLQYSSTNLVVRDQAKSNYEICCLGSVCDVSDLSKAAMSEWLPSGINDYGTDTIQVLGAACKNKSGVKKVRYAWASTPCEFKDCQIYSSQGFPAPPFVIDVMHDD